MKKSYKHKLKLKEKEKYIPKDKFPIIFYPQHSLSCHCVEDKR